MNFFCKACLTDKPIEEQSLDERYCTGCFDFLKEEARFLTNSPHWVPKVPKEIPSPAPEPYRQAIQSMRQGFEVDGSTSGHKPILHHYHKRGRKLIELPVEQIKELASAGAGSRKIAARLKQENISVSYSTIQRILKGENNGRQKRVYEGVS